MSEAVTVAPGRFNTCREVGLQCPPEASDWLHIYTFKSTLLDVCNRDSLYALLELAFPNNRTDHVLYGDLEIDGEIYSAVVAKPALADFFEPIIDFIESGNQIQPDRLVAMVTLAANECWRGWDISSRMVALQMAEANPDLMVAEAVPEELLLSFFLAFTRSTVTTETSS